MFCPSISSYLDIDNMYICKICGNLADDQCPTLTDAGAKSLKNMSLLIGDSDTLEFKINDKVSVHKNTISLNYVPPQSYYHMIKLRIYGKFITYEHISICERTPGPVTAINTC